MRTTRVVLVILVCGWCASGARVHAQTGTQDLKRMSLEDLLQVEVTTVSRRPEPTDQVPAAVFVITQDDIRRAGARSLADALRLAPGLQVAQIDGSKWATGTRGFADRLSRAMLVMIDGRAVYSPLFAGTYWEVQDTMLEDVDRIEVIRGPGGTLWGANAVNGIINVVTKQASQTQGLLATAEGGAYGRAVGALRYGGTARDGRLNYRFYGKGLQAAHEYHPTGADYDTSTMQQAGGRSDWMLGRQRTFTLQGDIYHEALGEQAVRTFYTPPYREVTNVEAPLAGGNVLARLSGAGAGGEFQLQTYYDRTTRDEVPVGEARDTFDVDVQQAIRPWDAHGITFGAGYRVSSGLITAVPPSAIVPERRTDNLFSAFAQDEITLKPERLRGSIGAKIEHNSYSGLEVQPSGRLLWTPHTAHTLFWAVTRAVRTPSRVETDYTTTSLASASGPAFVRLQPNPDFTSEKLVAYEMGYRARPVERVYATVSGFYNSLDDILSTELLASFTEGTPPEPPRTILPVMFRNGLFGESHGLEVTADARPVSWLRTTGNYSYVKLSITPDPGARDVSQQRRYEGISPRHQLQFQAAVDLPANFSADWMLRHASDLAVGPVPAYTTTTVRAGWRMNQRLELSVVGANLNDAHHLEWPGSLEIQRSVYVKMTWREK